MPHYWARFAGDPARMFRFDTRVYFADVTTPRRDDPAVGAIVAKNPGKAKPSDLDRRGMQAIRLDGDKLLPTVRGMVGRAFIQARREWPERGYVQVFNLFYLCNENLAQARAALGNGRIRTCSRELRPYPWLWYAWGESGAMMPDFAARFADLAADRRFYFDKIKGKIRNGHPARNAFPKHTQGLVQAPVVRRIARLLVEYPRR
ncbi:MAG TPA: hypothetical protein PKC18_00815 [Lacipirellulaceae bacterium]|nr:hypothetical protein [Lacipirellulaceae bacterium]